MSEGTRVSFTQGLSAAESVVARLAVGELLIAGSLRRGMESVGDIDLVAAMPGGGGDDPLHAAICRWFAPAGSSLFAAAGPRDAIGRMGTGVKPHFRFCSLVGVFGEKRTRDGETERGGDATGTVAVLGGAWIELPIQIHRYVAGERGNRGWIELLRTGPADFGQWFLSVYKRRRDAGLTRAVPASDLGFLLDGAGNPVPTPTEADCFALAGVGFIAPKDRVVAGRRGISLSSTRGAA